MSAPVPRRTSALVAAALLAAAGCGGGGRTHSLTGKVTYQGKPVIYGSVLVRCADGTQQAGNIQPDGTYTVADLPAGPVKLGVISPEPPDPASRPPPPGAPGAPPPGLRPVDRSKWFKLPEECGDPDKSGKAATVQAGTTTFDIQLP